VAHTPEKSRPLASKLKRVYAPRLISDHIMVQEDFERLHEFLLETEGLSEVSDDMRGLIEEEWPELVHNARANPGGLLHGRSGASRHARLGCFDVLRDTLPVGGRCLLVGGVASQAECPQSRSLFPRRTEFGLVLGHCLLALTQLLFFLEQSFGAPMRLIRIHAQSRNSLRKARQKITESHLYEELIKEGL
jgi:hypothetical protein